MFLFICYLVTYHLWSFQIPFFFINVIIYEWYRQLAYDDPGYIEPSRNDMLRMVEDVKNGVSLDRYCSTCWVKTKQIPCFKFFIYLFFI